MPYYRHVLTGLKRFVFLPGIFDPSALHLDPMVGVWQVEVGRVRTLLAVHLNYKSARFVLPSYTQVIQNSSKVRLPSAAHIDTYIIPKATIEPYCCLKHASLKCLDASQSYRWSFLSSMKPCAALLGAKRVFHGPPLSVPCGTRTLSKDRSAEITSQFC